MAPQLSPAALARLAPLPRAFYNRDPRAVARELLGKLLIRRLHRSQGHTELLAGRIVEAEAYLGAADPGAHAYRGPTARNAVLFGPPGHAYVYFIYGNHYCMNVSCEPVGEAGCVLLRALEPVSGIASMAELRGMVEIASDLKCDRHRSEAIHAGEDLQRARPTVAQLRRLTSGPGRLAQALGITRPQHNGCDLCSRSSGLYITAVPGAREGGAISTTPRINVSRAPHDEFRYLLTGNPFVSAKRL